MLQQIKEMNIISDFGLFSKEYSYYLHLQELSVCCKLVTTKTMFISIISSIFYDALNNEWFQTLWFISILFFYIGIWDSLTRLETININCNPISSIPTRMFKKNPNFRRFVWSNMGSKCVKGIRTEIWICVIYHESSSTCSYLFIGEGILLPSSMFDSKNLETIEIR